MNGYGMVMAILSDEHFTHAEARFLAKAVEHADQHTGRVHLSSEGVGRRACVKSRQTWAAAIAKAHALGYVAELATRDVIVAGLVKTQKDWSFASSPPTGRVEHVRSSDEGHRAPSATPVVELANRAHSAPPVVPPSLSTPGNTVDAERSPSTFLISPSLISTTYGDPVATEEATEERTRERRSEPMCERHIPFPADACPHCLSTAPITSVPEWKQRQQWEAELVEQGLSKTGD